MSKKSRSKSRNDERLFTGVIIALSLIFGAGFFLFILAMNHQEQTALTLPTDPASNLIPADKPRQLTQFSLTDRTGRTVTQEELNGKFLVVNFLFTSCGLTCPVVNGHMAEIQKLTTNRPDVKLVSLSVDPRDDTPAVLEKYSERFGAQTNRWLFLTGDKSELYHLIATSFLNQDLDPADGYMPGNFSHTERIALVDTNGMILGFFDGLNQNTASAVVEEINKQRNKNL